MGGAVSQDGVNWVNITPPGIVYMRQFAETAAVGDCGTVVIVLTRGFSENPYLHFLTLQLGDTVPNVR